MFLKITRSGPRQYLQLVEAFRDETGKAKHRTLVTLGRLDQLTNSLDSVISGLLKATGRPDVLNATLPAVEFESARALGNVWALTELWGSLGFGELRRVFRKTRHSIDVEALIRVMVFNRLCDPESKLGVLRWLETVAMPGIDTESITHQHLLRSMDALMEHQDEVDRVVTRLLRPLIDQDLSVVFYDMTTIRAEGLSVQTDDVRHYGMAKEGLIARQFMLGVVQTGDGLPIYHEVFDGNTAEAPTLVPTIKKVLQRFESIRRVVLVADRGLLSLDNLDALQEISLASGQPLEYVLAVPGRRYREFVDLLGPFHDLRCAHAAEEVIDEMPWRNLRLVVAHNPRAAQETNAMRQFFTYAIDEEALALAELMDGKLLLVTNTRDLSAQAVVNRYKSLADIERGFRVLKSEIEIGPVFHRLPQRIKAHASICFIALILYRVLRQRLHAAQSEFTPERALEQLQRLQHHEIRINSAAQTLRGISRLSDTHNRVFEALNLKKPAQPQQMSLL
jgi:transposase